MFMGAIGGVLVSVFPALPAALLSSPDLAAYAPEIGLVMLLLVGSSFVEFVAIANGEAHLAALFIGVSQVLRSGLFITAASLFGSVRALAYAAVVHGFLQCTLMAWYVRSRFSAARWAPEWRLVRAQLAYALPLAYAGIIWWLQGWVHHYFVSHRYDAAVYAVYAVGCFQVPIMGVLVESVGYVAIRRASELRKRNETREIVRLAAQSVRTLAAVAFPLYALLLVTGREFITVLFTEQYRASWPIFAVYLTLVPLTIVFPACDAVLRACPEHLPFLVRARTGLVTVLLAGLWIAVRRFDLVAPAAVVVGVTLVVRVLLAGKVARILGMSWSDLAAFRGLARLGERRGRGGAQEGRRYEGGARPADAVNRDGGAVPSGSLEMGRPNGLCGSPGGWSGAGAPPARRNGPEPVFRGRGPRPRHGANARVPAAGPPNYRRRRRPVPGSLRSAGLPRTRLRRSCGLAPGPDVGSPRAICSLESPRSARHRVGRR